MSVKHILTFVAVCLAFCSCGEKGHEDLPAEAPKLISTIPENGAAEQNTGSLDIVLTYDQDIRVSPAGQQKISISPEAVISSISPDGARLIISLDGLKEKTRYTLSIPVGTVEGMKPNQNTAISHNLVFTTMEAPLPPEPDYDLPARGDNDAWRMAGRLALGINLGNHMDAYINWQCDSLFYPGENVWGNPTCTQATMDGIKAAGFSTVRIPVTWLRYIGPAPDYKIDEKWLERVAEIVGYAREAGLNAIINTHHDEDHYIGQESLGHKWQNILDAARDVKVHEQIKDEVYKFWYQVAERFRDEGDYLIFESFNEVNDGGWGWSEDFRKDPTKQCDVLNDWNQKFVDAVRATGGNNSTRWISVPTYAANPSFATYFRMPSDPAGHTMLAVHCYDPYDYTLGEKQYEQWGHSGTEGKKDPYADEKALRSTFSSLLDNFIARNIPVYIGEFGCSMRKKGTRAWDFYLYYLEYFVKAAKTYGMGCLLWDNGATGAGREKHGYINHGTGAYEGDSEDVIKVMVDAMTNEDPDYTLKYIYTQAPRP